MNIALNDLTSELDALLDVSKLDARVVTPEPADVDLPTLLFRICDGFRPTAEAKGLTLLLDPLPPIFVHTDRKLFDRIVRNLVENAIKYTDAGQVRVAVERDGNLVRVVISDTGCGIRNPSVRAYSRSSIRSTIPSAIAAVALDWALPS